MAWSVALTLVLFLAVTASSYEEVQQLNEDDALVLLEESKSVAEMEAEVQAAKAKIAAAKTVVQGTAVQSAEAKKTMQAAKVKEQKEISEVKSTTKKAVAKIEEKVETAVDEEKTKLKKTADKVEAKKAEEVDTAKNAEAKAEEKKAAAEEKASKAENDATQIASQGTTVDQAKLDAQAAASKTTGDTQADSAKAKADADAADQKIATDQAAGTEKLAADSESAKKKLSDDKKDAESKQMELADAAKSKEDKSKADAAAKMKKSEEDCAKEKADTEEATEKEVTGQVEQLAEDKKAIDETKENAKTEAAKTVADAKAQAAKDMSDAKSKAAEVLAAGEQKANEDKDKAAAAKASADANLAKAKGVGEDAGNQEQQEKAKADKLAKDAEANGSSAAAADRDAAAKQATEDQQKGAAAAAEEKAEAALAEQQVGGGSQPRQPAGGPLGAVGQKNFLTASSMNSGNAGASPIRGTNSSTGLERPPPQGLSLQRGVPTGPGQFGSQVGQVGSQPRPTTPGGRGASPRMETRSSTSAASEVPASNERLEPRAANGTAGGSGQPPPPSPWDMAATGGAGMLLAQRGGEASPSAGGNLHSLGGQPDDRGAPANRRELTPGSRSGPGFGQRGEMPFGSTSGAGQRRELTPTGGQRDSRQPGLERPRDLTPPGGAGYFGGKERPGMERPGMERPGMERPGMERPGMQRDTTPRGMPPSSGTTNTAAPLVGSLGGRPSSPGPGGVHESFGSRSVTAPSQQGVGVPAFNMQAGSSMPFGAAAPGQAANQRSPGRQTANTTTQPPSANAFGFQGAEPFQGIRKGSDVSTELEQAKLRELEAQNAELNKRLDEDGLQFLEALISLEGQVEELSREKKKLLEERDSMEGGLLQQGSDGELRAKIMKMERERQDMLQQLDEFEREKEEDLKQSRETADGLRKTLGACEQEFKRRTTEQERERENLVEMVANEGREAQVRIEKLVREKEALNSELAKALARAEATGGSNETGQDGGVLPSSSKSLSEANSQLRVIMGEREALKDEVTNKNGQILLLQSQLEIKDRKLRIADMENNMLKSELEQLRRGSK